MSEASFTFGGVANFGGMLDSGCGVRYGVCRCPAGFGGHRATPMPRLDGMSVGGAVPHGFTTTVSGWG